MDLGGVDLRLVPWLWVARYRTYNGFSLIYNKLLDDPDPIEMIKKKENNLTDEVLTPHLKIA